MTKTPGPDHPQQQQQFSDHGNNADLVHADDGIHRLHRNYLHELPDAIVLSLPWKKNDDDHDGHDDDRNDDDDKDNDDGVERRHTGSTAALNEREQMIDLLHRRNATKSYVSRALVVCSHIWLLSLLIILWIVKWTNDHGGQKNVKLQWCIWIGTMDAILLVFVMALHTRFYQLDGDVQNRVRRCMDEHGMCDDGFGAGTSFSSSYIAMADTTNDNINDDNDDAKNNRHHPMRRSNTSQQAQISLHETNYHRRRMEHKV